MNLQWICWCEFTASKLFVHSANNTSLRWCLWGWLGQTTMIWSCRPCPSFIMFGSKLLVFPSCFCFVFCNNLVNVNVGCVGNVQLEIYFVCINICCYALENSIIFIKVLHLFYNRESNCCYMISSLSLTSTMSLFT